MATVNPHTLQTDIWTYLYSTNTNSASAVYVEREIRENVTLEHRPSEAELKNIKLMVSYLPET